MIHPGDYYTPALSRADPPGYEEALRGYPPGLHPSGNIVPRLVHKVKNVLGRYRRPPPGLIYQPRLKPGLKPGRPSGL